jgi:hypothetical protein
MARPPAGPIGNSPRDVRDDAVGVPPDVIEAGEPLRWPPKHKKITKNTFHAKVSGGASAKRADRQPHFRKGGFVKGYKKGGFVVSPRSEDVVEHRRAKSQVADLIDKKREDLPGVQKNDTSSDQNLSGKPVKFEDKPIFQPSDMRRKAKLQAGGAVQGKRMSGIPGPPSDDTGKKKHEVPQYQGGGKIK